MIRTHHANKLKTALLAKGYEQLNAVERLKFWTQFIVGNGLN